MRIRSNDFRYDRPRKKPTFEPPKTAPWATWVQGRTPNFKTHATMGLAKQARAYHGKGTLVYEWVDGWGWAERTSWPS